MGLIIGPDAFAEAELYYNSSGTTCETDLNADSEVNVLDLIELLLCFGSTDAPPCDSGQDINGDGTVNVLDMIELLTLFGTTCP